MNDNPCLNCGFYDPDFGCGCPSMEPWLCPLEDPENYFDMGENH